MGGTRGRLCSRPTPPTGLPPRLGSSLMATTLRSLLQTSPWWPTPSDHNLKPEPAGTEPELPLFSVLPSKTCKNVISNSLSASTTQSPQLTLLLTCAQSPPDSFQDCLLPDFNWGGQSAVGATLSPGQSWDRCVCVRTGFSVAVSRAQGPTACAKMGWKVAWSQHFLQSWRQSDNVSPMNASHF